MRYLLVQVDPKIRNIFPFLSSPLTCTPSLPCPTSSLPHVTNQIIQVLPIKHVDVLPQQRPLTLLILS